MSCGRYCKFNWDTRCCCEPNCPKKNSITQFNNCSQKINTLYFHIFNNYDIYTFLEMRNNILNKLIYYYIKTILFNNSIYDLDYNVYSFLENGDYLTTNNIKLAVNMLSNKIIISDEECKGIIDLYIEEN
jgi:hypothetical protein